MPSTASHYLQSARRCRVYDLEELLLLIDLVGAINALIHALQKERGASSIFLGSGGAQFASELMGRVQESRQLESSMHGLLEGVDRCLERRSSGAAFYTRAAIALHGLEGHARTRQQIVALGMTVQQSFNEHTRLIAQLLSVVFEVADIAGDVGVSGALIALANFVQGKEYAGQERATGGGAISLGRIDEEQLHRLRHLVTAQNHAFRFFMEFAAPEQIEALGKVLAGRASSELKRARKVLFASGIGKLPGLAADAWFEWTTRRMDAMQEIEGQLMIDLRRLCDARLQEARAALERNEDEAIEVAEREITPVAMLVADVDPQRNGLGLGVGVGLFTLDAGQARTLRPILEVIQAQSRRLDDVRAQLDSARAALDERKLIERAKDVLMEQQGVSGSAAYESMRTLSMRQHKRLAEIADKIVAHGAMERDGKPPLQTAEAPPESSAATEDRASK